MEDAKQTQGLTAEQLEKIGGGDGCTATQIVDLVGNLTQAYEGLVDFTSHVIERVITARS